ncbi:hypothetical protein [Arthrobacter sp. Y-9]|uniref:hypothetical protein n=1 Tax=Arthrobacter sp. Y-9 TaxID=3039385 RepID=UPI00241E61BA|nr:hypothetical protein [Arthrobacter sp. Y-9]WFR83198.1 hypothetical protein P9849_11610 [Arthrobacter sp. Y-9]
MSRRRHLRLWITLVLLASLVAGGIWVAVQLTHSISADGPELCTTETSGQKFQLTPEQSVYASLISAVGVSRELPPRASSIAIATAIQESNLRNLNYGDAAGPDSRGLFQQRPSQGWGTEAQIMDPYYSTATFYKALVKVPNYQSIPLTEAAQTVQRSAFPEAYADHESEGRAFASALTGQSPASFSCSLAPAPGAGDPQAVRKELAKAFPHLELDGSGREVRVDVSGTAGWAVAHWAVAHAKAFGIDRVDYDTQTWLRENRDGWRSTHALGHQVVITLASGPGA